MSFWYCYEKNEKRVGYIDHPIDILILFDNILIMIFDQLGVTFLYKGYPLRPDAKSISKIGSAHGQVCKPA
jgi:hypothetical protein